jgi:hypothetical protein
LFVKIGANESLLADTYTVFIESFWVFTKRPLMLPHNADSVEIATDTTGGICF